MGTGLYGGFGNTYGSQSKQIEIKEPSENQEVRTEELTEEKKLIAELKERKIKFTEKDIVFVTRDKTGQIVWLERGNSRAGLEHIINGDGKTPGHLSDFAKAFEGITKENLPLFLKDVVSNGKVISDTIKVINNRQGYERVYYYCGQHYVLTGIGTNGFIVSAYPIRKE